MTQTEITADLAAKLIVRSVPHTLADLQAFVAGCWRQTTKERFANGLSTQNRISGKRRKNHSRP
jgi:hypothetical protein